MAAVELERSKGGVARLRLNRPQTLNALTWEAMSQFAEHIEELHNTRDVNALVVHGAGPAFCSGGDLYELHAYPTRADGARLATVMGEALRRLERLPFPTLAAIEGPALGGGAEIALACDLRVIAQGASFGMMHVKLAIGPAWGGGQRLLRLVGYARALEWLASAKVLDAPEAVRHGLALQLVPEGTALEHGLDLAQRIARLDPQAVRAVKSCLQVGLERGPAEAHRAERETFADLWAADPHLEASEAFVSRKNHRTAEPTQE